jgi:hypothetical protein
VSAKALSENGHTEKRQSEQANADANDLRQRLSASLHALQSARRALDTETKSKSQKMQGQADHLANAGVDLIGFQDEQLWRNVLNTLPPVGFSHIKRIEYIDTARTDGAEGEVVNRFLPGQSAELRVYRHPIEFDAKVLRYKQAWTLCHEYAHVVFDRIIPTKHKAAWGKLYNDHLSGSRNGAWVSPRAKTSLREDFCECFAAYRIKPNTLEKADPERYSLMNKIVEGL